MPLQSDVAGKIDDSAAALVKLAEDLVVEGLDPGLPAFRAGAWGFKFRSKPVAPLGYRFDVSGGGGIVPRCTPNLIDGARQRVVADEGFLPNLLEQLLLFDDAATILDQV